MFENLLGGIYLVGIKIPSPCQTTTIYVQILEECQFCSYMAIRRIFALKS